MSDVYIVGIDMIKFGRFPDRTVESLGGEAALMALDDAGLTVHDMQAVYSGCNIEANRMVGQRIMREIGQTAVPVVNVANACATGATAVREGWTAIKAGLYDLVLCVGSERMGKGLLGSATAEDGISPEGILGSQTTPAMFSLIGMEHTRKYGTSFRQFAQVSVKNHFHASMNPKAMYQHETPIEMVMSSEMIAYPNTKLMCSVNVDGAAAAVLASESAVRRLGLMDRAIRIRGTALASDPFSPRNIASADVNPVTRIAAQVAYDMAGVGPEDLDLVELHDCFATAEIVHYENLGLCPDGEGGAFIDSGATMLGGKIPVNVSGGLLSKGHPLGATGIANMCEVATHLRGKAGQRQVADAKIGLCHVVGLGWARACAVHILEKT